jgi:hypothetical protein
MQRTIGEADAIRDEASGLSPAEQREAESDVTREKARAASIGTETAERLFLELQEVGSGALDAFDAIPIDADALANDLRTGRCSVEDGRARVEELLRRHASAAAGRERFTEGAETVGTIAEDPEAWVEQLYVKFPSLRPEWRW